MLTIMCWLSAARVRALTPACPPGWLRLATLIVVAGLVIVLIDRGTTPSDLLVVLGGVGTLTAMLTAPASPGRGGAQDGLQNKAVA